MFEPSPVEAHGTRDTNAQRDAPEELPREKAATIHPIMAGGRSPKVRQPQKKKGPSSSLSLPLLVKKKKHPTTLKHLPRTCTKPPSQRRLLTSALYPKTTVYRNRPSDPRSRFDHTEVTHKDGGGGFVDSG